ncbi:heat shock factor binding protein [Schizosaccharomyces cryophilus OY26]|uniref:Heat shock factor binding protein n=1 Tax=Schizosaccharomyces cryophilus (strain OY26 / ATCC MYA-4695 / CBS 11777 / NBRC 106824 / NRRL Y48691) TaxID=653667 RepID=S9W237_SCHCR|nr:heat shock factor binding protein [Schizosaccharomyces cryophilus OY26]EPY54108.1 heat shock factor binding protein [Schizosaccharomyces cryophilus OY26]
MALTENEKQESLESTDIGSGINAMTNKLLDDISNEFETLRKQFVEKLETMTNRLDTLEDSMRTSLGSSPSPSLSVNPNLNPSSTVEDHKQPE